MLDPPPSVYGNPRFFRDHMFSGFSYLGCINLDFYAIKGKVGILNEYSQLISSSPASGRGLALSYPSCFSLDFDSYAFFSFKKFMEKGLTPPPYGNFHKKIIKEFLKPQ